MSDEDRAATRALVEEVMRLQHLARPRGMPPEPGLLYQPIPFPEFSDLPCERDSSARRLDLLRSRIDFAGKRVLDLGCANGFFLFSLAMEDGIAGGTGVDHFSGNVATCRLLAEHHAVEGLDFVQAELSLESVGRILEEAGDFDVCLLLSVHHHLLRDLGVEETRGLFRLLHERVPLLVVEQGSLTQEEYRAWTAREEPFATRAYSRLISMAGSAGIEEGRAFPVGAGRYLSGRRPDEEGSDRVIVGFSRDPRPDSVRGIERKAHKNGIYMEILRLGEGPEERIWKNVVTGGSHAPREAMALARLADAPGFPRFVDPGAAVDEAARGLIRMRSLRCRRLREEDLEGRRAELRAGVLARLWALADAGIVHNELGGEHVQLSEEHGVCVLDLETARFVEEDLEAWLSGVADPNPALGLGSYPRDLLRRRPDDVDLVAVDGLLVRWGCERLTSDEISEYRRKLDGARSRRG